MKLPDWPIPYFDGGRWTWLDAMHWAMPGGGPVVTEFQDELENFGEIPLDRLHDACTVQDLRHLDRTIHYDPKIWGYFRDKMPKVNVPKRAKPFGKRKASKTTAILLHTMMVEVGWRRCLGMPVQLGCDEDAVAVLCHHLLALLAHAHSANRFAVGIECSGLSAITDDQIVTMRALVRYAYEEIIRLRKLEGDDNERVAIMTHFMATNKRGLRDPGIEIWEAVGLWAIKELGLVMGPVIGKGQAPPALTSRRWP